MLNGIAKTLRKDDEITLVDIESHDENVGKIVNMFAEGLVGNRILLGKASSIHDLWKSRTMRPEQILKGTGSLFPYHAAHFPSSLIDKNFDEIEFDPVRRRENYDKYYVLNLVRLHHSGFGTTELYGAVDFIYESGKSVRDEIMSFIRDWYALTTADWVDSAILSSVFQGIDLERDLRSDIEFARAEDESYYIAQEGVLTGDLRLHYRSSSMTIDELKSLIDRTKSRAGGAVNDSFLERKKEIREVILRGSRGSIQTF